MNALDSLIAVIETDRLSIKRALHANPQPANSNRLKRVSPLCLTVLAAQTIHLLDVWRKALLWPLSLGMRLWTRTLRLRMSEEDRRRIMDTGKPTIVIFWHNRLFLACEVYRRFRLDRAMYGLISASRDGAWLAAFMSLSRLHAIRGSSSRRGREALHELEQRLQEGNDVAITPDGPRGPAYSFKAGAPLLAARTGARVLLVNASFTSAWRLRSWDGFFLPKPFSTVTLRTAFADTGEAVPRNPAARATAWKAVLQSLDGEDNRSPQ